MQYRLLPMTRSIISELFSPQQVQDHVRLIEAHLTFADGVRLMNKPVPYKGGVRVFFRRAEEAANFGREIGLQYVHAHIRYIEAMCKIGLASKAYEAILQILPLNIQEHVRNAKTRQNNTYFSSSDADVKDRYEAEHLFEALRAGNVPVKGGWRVYSSGPGILINQVITNFFGIRDYYEYRVIDPVLPRVLNGLRYTCEENGTSVTYVFSITGDEPAAVQSIMINGHDVAFVRQEHPYRHGGAMIECTEFYARFNSAENIVDIVVR
jgi:1,2-beta-oligoglucan phosphorylase